MRKNFIILSTLVIVLTFSSTVFAVCAPGSSWTAVWTDQYGQTTYSLEAPCKVYIGIPFSITATVTDTTYLNNYVACMWSITDNGTVIAGGNGFNWLQTVNGQWQDVVGITYSGIPVDHTFQFSFIDLGQGGGAHFWKSNLIGAVTVDPYPPVVNNPPTVDAGPDIYLTTETQNSTVLQGHAYDADGNTLIYRWLEGDTVLQSSLSVDGSGNAPLNLANIYRLSIGTHVFTLEVSDGTVTVKDTVVVSVANSAPTVVASGAGTYQIGEAISLNGEVADFDGDTLTYRWLDGQTVLAAGVISTSPGGTPVKLPEYQIARGLPLGSHTIILEVSDGIDTVSEKIVVNIIDTIAPTVAPVASTSILWPPNGGMIEVSINARAHDNSGGPILLGVRVSSNEVPRKGKAGEVVPDYQVSSIDQSTGIIVLKLRSARSGKGGDRVYSVTITASDASDNSSSAEVLIKVPHDRGLHKGQLRVSHAGKKKH